MRRRSAPIGDHTRPGGTGSEVVAVLALGCTRGPRRQGAIKLLTALSVFGATPSACSSAPSGPPNVDQRSAPHESLDAKRDFLERYVTFRRKYEALDYVVSYHDNSGGCVPGPSDVDIALVAQVPREDLAVWTRGLHQVASRPQQAPNLESSIPTDGVRVWYEGTDKVVGLDPDRSVVMYRIWSH